MEEEEWRDLGLEVPKQLLQVGTTKGTLTLTEIAHAKLALRADRLVLVLVGLGALSAGELDAATIAVSDPALEKGKFNVEALEDALREIARAGAMHRMAGRLSALHAAHLGLMGGDDPRWRSWEGHRAEAERRADAAAKRVLSALSQVHASRDILDMTIQAPFQHLAYAMAPAVRQIAHRARDEAALALHEVREMRRAVLLEFFDAWALLRR